ncbi:right-handed parallel beta-helix repeat-containing protein [bacterium]|nr:right-handed parallel beta-helix repeat-containing protein [bacterium]
MRSALLLLLLTSALAAGENLFPNGDLAKGLEGWYAPDSPHRVTFEAKDLPPGAPRSVRIDITKEAANLGQLGRYISGLKKHTTYTVQAMARSSIRGMAYVQIKLIRDKRELRRIGSDRSDVKWTRIIQEFDTGDADRVAVLCRYRQSREAVGSTVWFADVQLSEGRSPEPGEAPQPGPPTLGKTVAVPTFHAAGVTVPYGGTVLRDVACRMRYRQAEVNAWTQGMDLVRYGPDRQFRGSLLLLRPDTDYEIECQLVHERNPLATVQTATRTWSEDTPIGEVRTLPPVTKGALVIKDQGKPDAWIVYRPAEGQTATVDAGTDADNAVRIENAAYVIIENVAIRGGRDDCVHVSKSHHIRIRRCDIAGWGDAGARKDGLPFGLYVDARDRIINNQAGIQLHADSAQVVVEYNLIHAPRGTANSWKYGHPAGPQGINLSYTAGNNVVRYNDLIGSETHWWNDAIEGAPNRDVIGGPHRDTDIYGNVFAFSNDDGSELDGGQINVRFWGNWVDKALCGVSCAPNRRGPSYVFRNLLVLTGDEHFRTGAGFKMGGDQFRHAGVAFLLHNTVYTAGQGLTSGHYGKGPTPVVTRNNVFFGPAPGLGRIRYRHKEMGDFDYDLIPPDGIYGVTPLPAGREAHAVFGRPKVRDETARDMRLLADSPGIDAGIRLPGLNDGFTGKGPDLGAFEREQQGQDFPVRPGGLSALPLHTELTTGSATIRLRVPPSAGPDGRPSPTPRGSAARPHPAPVATACRS